MATVSFDHVTKRFGTVSAVDDFDLHIEEREFVVFVGPSGCGKTTALRMVAGLEQPSEGFIRIDGRIVNDVPPKDRDIAMVFQNYALYPHMTVRRNMSFGLRLRHTEAREAEARVAEAAEILQIGHLLERRPKELSGGQRQRVALGRAIVRKPKVFLMDEPLSNLDAKLRVEMRASLAELHQALGVTTIYVTHDQVEAMTMGTRIVVMKEGRIQQVDTPTRLYQHPASKFVGGFIGSPAMNFLTGRVEGERIVGPAFNVGPDPDLVARLAPYQGREVYFGIRPENLDLKGLSDFPDDNVVRAVVKLVEPIGAETIVIGVAEGGQDVVARVDPEADVAVGDTVDLLVNPRKMQAFDLDTEQNLHPDPPISPRLPTPTPDADRPTISNPVG